MDSVVAPLPFSNQGLSIEDSGSMYVITTPAGLIIKWTHLTGIIDIHFGSQFNLSSYTEGLCGERCFSNICFFFFFFLFTLHSFGSSFSALFGLKRCYFQYLLM